MSEREETTGWRADLNGLCDRADYGETPDGMKRDEVEPAHARIQAHVEALERDGIRDRTAAAFHQDENRKLAAHVEALEGALRETHGIAALMADYDSWIAGECGMVMDEETLNYYVPVARAALAGKVDPTE